MKILKDYTINHRTVLLSGENDCTRVIEGENAFLVKMTPLEMINKSLLRNGTSLRGALRSSKFILGPMNLFPIKVSTSQGIFLFPLKSDKTMWFSLNHILSINSKGFQQTEVHLSFGHSLLLNVEAKMVTHKMYKAEELRKEIIKNSKGPLVFYLEGAKRNN
ncbi:MAG: competence protein ComK [Bacillota bacterium]|nr:competence protein ComK [Bacillota bacterium]